MTPIERTTFYEEQAVNRRRTFKFAGLSILAVLLAGIPISVIVTPILFLFVLTGAHLINLFTPISPAFWAFLDQTGRTVPVVAAQIEHVVDTKSLGGVDWTLMAEIALAVIIPGMAAMLLAWLWVKALFRRAGTGGVLLSLGARLPKPNDLEERQLVNLVEEMSIAAGIRPPAVMLLDRSAANVATVGSSETDAALVVTRGLLEKLDRNQTQAIIGHGIASIVNGDLIVLTRLLSVFQAFGLLGVILAAPAEAGARRSLWRAIKSTFRRRDRTEIEQVAALLASGEATDPKDHHQGSSGRSPGILAVIIIPVGLGAATAQFLSMLGSQMVYGPLLAAVWRARRYLADMSAVQLTRNPTALASALPLLDSSDKSMMPGVTSLLFVAGSGSGSIPVWGGFHPNVWKRRNRLEAAGAVVVHGTGKVERHLLRRILLFPLMAFAYAVFAVGMVVAAAGALLLMGVSLLFIGMAMLAVHAAFTYGPPLIHWIVTKGPGTAKQIATAIGELIKHLTR
ncbi:MAG: M48 family metalloprotease [Gemmatimonadota bacterium]